MGFASFCAVTMLEKDGSIGYTRRQEDRYASSSLSNPLRAHSLQKESWRRKASAVESCGVGVRSRRTVVLGADADTGGA